MAEFTPRVTFITDHLNDKFPGLGNAGTYPGHGEDGAEYAADFWTTNKTVHDEVLIYVIANARNLGVKYIISWRRIWSVARSNEGIRPYTRYGDNATPSQNHTNHVHISFDPGSENMAVEISLSDATITKLAEGIRKGLDADKYTPPAGHASTTNPKWRPSSFEKFQTELLENILAELKKP